MSDALRWAAERGSILSRLWIGVMMDIRYQQTARAAKTEQVDCSGKSGNQSGDVSVGNVDGKEKRGRTNRPSPQSPKGILGSSPPRANKCKPFAIHKGIVFIGLNWKY